MWQTVIDILDPITPSNSTGDSTSTLKKWKPYLVPSAVLLTTTAGVLYSLRERFRARPHDNIPTIAPDQSTYFGGHIQRLIEVDSLYYPWLYEEARKSGFPVISCLKITGPQHFVFIHDPKLVQFVFETHFEDTHKAQSFQEEYEELLGNGIFTVNGEQWKFHRKASRMFSMKNMKSMMYDITTKNVKSTINKLKELSMATNEIDINDILGRFTLDTFAEIAFGVNIRSVETYPKKHEFGVAFDDLVCRLDWRGLDIFWKFKRFFNVGGEWHIRRDHQVVQQFVNGILDEKNLGKTTASIRDADGGRQQFDLLSLFMKHNPDLEHDLTRDQLRDIALNFIVEFLGWI